MMGGWMGGILMYVLVQYLSEDFLMRNRPPNSKELSTYVQT